MSNYLSKSPDQSGNIFYTPEENETWNILYERQLKVVQNRACPEFIEGLEKLGLPKDRVPQCHEVTNKLQLATGWSVKAVPAMISLKEFFVLLSNKQFPAATFIRKKEELDYLKEPDIFHEFFGHCPLLTNKAYADFVNWYGIQALQTSEKIQSLLGRLFWFTIEFGLLHTEQGVRIYGGGILSSFQETVYALESMIPKKINFDIMEVLKTKYRYDIIQDRYFVLPNLNELYNIQQKNIIELATTIAQDEFQDKNFNVC